MEISSHLFKQINPFKNYKNITIYVPFYVSFSFSFCPSSSFLSSTLLALLSIFWLSQFLFKFSNPVRIRHPLAFSLLFFFFHPSFSRVTSHHHRLYHFLNQENHHRSC